MRLRSLRVGRALAIAFHQGWKAPIHWTNRITVEYRHERPQRPVHGADERTLRLGHRVARQREVMHHRHQMVAGDLISAGNLGNGDQLVRRKSK